VLPTPIVPLITIIIWSLKESAAATAAPSTQEAGTDRYVDRTSETDPQRLTAVAVRQIRLELARAPGHPKGDAAIAYVHRRAARFRQPDRPKTLAGASRRLPDRATAPGRG
jgi:hypothetical protein